MKIFNYGFGDTREYELYGVKYIVTSSFQTAKDKTHLNIGERFKRVFKSKIAHLPRKCGFDTMAVGKVCTTAGKED